MAGKHSVSTGPLSTRFKEIFEDDGRVEIDVDSHLGKTLSWIVEQPPAYSRTSPAIVKPSQQQVDAFPLKLKIVIQVVGSRGDVQPFIALGCALQDHGHRVRLATHQKFSAFVQDAGLEFFAIGGNPDDLMAYMVKNPGLLPSMRSLKAGDISQKRSMVTEILDGCWRSCIETGPGSVKPFTADAIIANPPSFAHVHCAQALGIPVHIMFTMPWSSTTAFAHPLAKVKGRLGSPEKTNYMTHVLVQWLTWQGLGDLVNKFRDKLGLDRVPTTEGPLLVETLRVPHTYCWSPALIPKPADWDNHINVAGFFFRKTPDYKPSAALQQFLADGPPPIYVGFGSIVLEDARHVSEAIAEAVKRCGVRAIVSPGWAKLHVPSDRADLFRLEECPHEWLFKHVSMVIHHGGAGTTAIGLKEARPTIIVPFFGDQSFWAEMVATAGAGSKPIPQRELSSERLAEAIEFCKTQAAQESAANLSAQITKEDGVQAAVRSFHDALPLSKMQCDILKDQPACWRVKAGGQRLKLSKTAATVLVHDTKLTVNKLSEYQPQSFSIVKRRWDPATAIFSSLISTSAQITSGATGILLEPSRDLRQSYRDRRRKGPSLNDQMGKDTSLEIDTDVKIQSLDFKGDATGSITTDRQAEPQMIATHSSKSTSSIIGMMASGSAKSAGKMVSSGLKGVLVDLPLATAEGFRFLPRLWGDDIKDHGEVKDWQSGALVAGKSIVACISDGARDVVMNPIEGAKSGGVLGATKGLGAGLGSLASGICSASVGVVAYPGQGVARSVQSAMHKDVQRSVTASRLAAGERLTHDLLPAERQAIVRDYNGRCQKPRS